MITVIKKKKTGPERHDLPVSLYVYMVILKKDTGSGDKSRVKEDTSAVCRSFEYSSEAYGAAVDIGTTNVAVAVYSLDKASYGRLEGSISERNEQAFAGSDVMSRISYCLGGKEDELHRRVVNQVERMILNVVPGDRGHLVKQIAVTGNTTMCHIFLNRDVKGLAGAPFRPAYKGAVSLPSASAGMEKINDAEIYVMSGISSHVGADALSVLCETGIPSEESPSEAVDIGTNAEVILKSGNNIFVTSAAAGPAFEGAGMKCGMCAGPGAVTGIRLVPASKTMLVNCIPESNGEIHPKGICAAGYIDLISGLVKAGLVTPEGRLLSREEAEKTSAGRKFSDRIITSEGQNAFLIFGEKDVSHKGILLYNKIGKSIGQTYGQTYEGVSPVLMTQSDIHAFQEAKAAVYAGLDILRIRAGLRRDDVKRVYVAGMFGTSINKKECIEIKMLPYRDESIYRSVGNSALRGCVRALLDESFRKYTESTASACTHVELADSEAFKRLYISAFSLKA